MDQSVHCLRANTKIAAALASLSGALLLGLMFALLFFSIQRFFKKKESNLFIRYLFK